MKIGLEIGGYWPGPERNINDLFPEMMNVVKKVDEIGFEAIICGEHHFMDYGATPSPISVLCNIAPQVKVPRLIAAILMLPVHNVGVLAGEITQADHLTNGRLEIGPARGGGSYEFDRLVMPSDMAATREKFDEQFMLLQRLLKEENVTYEGKFNSLHNATVMPPPLRKPHPPIWQTCQREEAAYHCAKNGFHVFTSSLRRPMSYVLGLRDAFRAGVAESKKPQGEPEFAHLQWVYVGKNDDDVREKLKIAYIKQEKWWGLWTNSLKVKGGIIPPVPMEDTIDDVAKGLIFGTKDYVYDKMMEFKEAGVDLMALKTGFGESNADEIGSLDRFAEYILPDCEKKEVAVTA